MESSNVGGAFSAGMFFILFFLIVPSGAFAHDVDGNGQEGLAEAIHALQVAAGLTPDTSSPIGNALPSQVFSGVTFSNDNETGLVGEYHGPPGCTTNRQWFEWECWNDCMAAYGIGSTDYSTCLHDWCTEVQYNWTLQVWIANNICI